MLKKKKKKKTKMMTGEVCLKECFGSFLLVFTSVLVRHSFHLLHPSNISEKTPSRSKSDTSSPPQTSSMSLFYLIFLFPSLLINFNGSSSGGGDKLLWLNKDTNRLKFDVSRSSGSSFLMRLPPWFTFMIRLFMIEVFGEGFAPSSPSSFGSTNVSLLQTTKSKFGLKNFNRGILFDPYQNGVAVSAVLSTTTTTTGATSRNKLLGLFRSVKTWSLRLLGIQVQEMDRVRVKYIRNSLLGIVLNPALAFSWALCGNHQSTTTSSYISGGGGGDGGVSSGSMSGGVLHFQGVFDLPVSFYLAFILSPMLGSVIACFTVKGLQHMYLSSASSNSFSDQESHSERLFVPREVRKAWLKHQKLLGNLDWTQVCLTFWVFNNIITSLLKILI
jgi:hypothetical protein